MEKILQLVTLQHELTRQQDEELKALLKSLPTKNAVDDVYHKTTNRDAQDIVIRELWDR